MVNNDYRIEQIKLLIQEIEKHPELAPVYADLDLKGMLKEAEIYKHQVEFADALFDAYSQKRN